MVGLILKDFEGSKRDSKEVMSRNLPQELSEIMNEGG
jgi:hypothetical protein